jgi:hypothetical protein
MSPRRIQRKRTKGWRMPKGAVYVGRPTKWGNPCRSKGVAAVTAYRCWIEQSADGRVGGVDRGGMFTKPFPTDDLHELRGKNLACWCGLDQPCHAEVLLQMANS